MSEGLYPTTAEQSALGAALFGRADDLLQWTQAGDYHAESHRTIYRGVQRLRSKGIAVDLVTLAGALRETGDIDVIGGEAYLIRLAEVVPAPDHVRDYCRVVTSAATLRDVEAFGAKLQGWAQAGEDVADILARIAAYKSQRAASGSKPIQVADLDPEAPIEGVQTPFSRVNMATGVGLVSGQVTVVSAYHKGGKSSLMVQLAAHAAEHTGRTVYASFADLSPSHLMRRVMKQETGWASPPEFGQAREDWFAMWRGYQDHVFGPHLEFYSGRDHGRTVEDLRAVLLDWHRESPIRLVCVDYAQKLRSRTRTDGRTNELEYCSQVLSETAEDMGIPIVLGSQITRGDGGSVTKYARAIEEDAGLVIRLEHDEKTDEREFDLPYNRFGPSARFPVRWNADRVKFEEVEL